MQRVIGRGVILPVLFSLAVGGASAQFLSGEPFQETGQLQLNVGDFAETAEIFTVPPGKRLVLQHVGIESGVTLAAGSNTFVKIFVFETAGPFYEAEASTMFTLTPEISEFAGEDKMTLMFAEEGQSIGLELRRNGLQTTELFRATLTGYLIDVP